MGLTALVMAGGRGSRMKLGVEKPLLDGVGRPMIEHVINALKGSRSVDDVIVAVSRYTPRTAEKVKMLSVKTIQTPGEGYIADMQYAIKKLKLGRALVVSADLPLITSRIIEQLAKFCEGSSKPALSVMCPVEVFERLGLKPEYEFKVRGRVVAPVGLNVIDGAKIDESKIDEEILVLDDQRLAMNVNTVEDARIAEQRLASFKTQISL